MAEPQLSVRSARAREIAHRLARRERRSIAEVVERALTDYEIRETGRQSAADFHADLASNRHDDVDLEAVIQSARRPHPGLDL